MMSLFKPFSTDQATTEFPAASVLTEGSCCFGAMSLLTRKSAALGVPVLVKNRAEMPKRSAGLVLSQVARKVPAAVPDGTPATEGERFRQSSQLLTLKVAPLGEGTARATAGTRASTNAVRMNACLAFIR
jgi:hypothetical protein